MARNNSDISNKTLALLVGVAIVVSLVGIFSVSRGPLGITGAQVANTTVQVGVTNFTILEVLSVTLDDNRIQFGVGRIVNGTNATLDSFAATTVGGESFLVCNNCSGDSVNHPDSMRIRNSGSVTFSLDVIASKNTTTYIDGDDVDPLFRFRVADESTTCGLGGVGGGCEDALFNSSAPDTAVACKSGLNTSAFTGACSNFNTTAGNISGCSPFTSQIRICDNVTHEENQDEFDFFVQLRVPQDTSPGEKVVNVTFTVTSNS